MHPYPQAGFFLCSESVAKYGLYFLTLKKYVFSQLNEKKSQHGFIDV